MMRSSRSVWMILFAVVTVRTAHAQPAQCPNPAPNPPPVTISSTLPADVCIPTPPPSGVPFAFFDDFSWRSFIPMVWPALAGQRGVPDTSKTVGDTSVPLVFETLKPDWDVFQPQGAPPADWNQVSPVNPCNQANLGISDLMLVSFSKFTNVGQANFGFLTGPLPSQNVQYTRYLTAFNQVEFNQISSQKLYLQANIPPTGTVTFKPDAQQNNPIDVKSSWILMSGISHPERYYTRQAWVMDLNTNTCSQQKVGLVGLHIVSKTPSRPQWIWSTFEQLDNVPDPPTNLPPPPVPPLTYNDGTGTAMPLSNPIPYPPPPTPPQVYNVTRLLQIADSTQTTNQQYQKALAGKGTGVWQFYRLVMTQWPVAPNSPTTPGTPNNTFPGNGATTSFSNVTMETFEQAKVNTGCMNCHTTVMGQTDFLWSLALNAFPSQVGTPPSQPQFTLLKTPANDSPALAKLRALLKEAMVAHAAAVKAQSTKSPTKPPSTKPAATKPAATKPAPPKTKPSNK